MVSFAKAVVAAVALGATSCAAPRSEPRRLGAALRRPELGDLGKGNLRIFKPDDNSADYCDHSKLLQYGESRSGSTFQWYTICSLMRACALKRGAAPESVCCQKPSRCPSNATAFVSKVHTPPVGMPHAHIFRSERDGHVDGKFAVRQRYDELIDQGAYIVHSYASLFPSLRRSDFDVVVAHMRLWAILRQCCGSQQSLESRLALHNSTLSPRRPKRAVDHSQCRMYNLAEVERLMLATALGQRHPESIWLSWREDQFVTLPLDDVRIRPGFCSRTNAAIANGADFNNIPWGQFRKASGGTLRRGKEIGK